MASSQSEHLIQSGSQVEGVFVLAAPVKGAGDRETLRALLDQLKSRYSAFAIVLASIVGDEVRLIAGVSSDCLQYFNATALLNQVAHQVGGKGGGRPEMAQGAGSNPSALVPALKTVLPWVTDFFSKQ